MEVVEEEIDGKVVSERGVSSAKKSRPIEVRKVAVPKHRFTPLKENWMKIFTPVVEHMKLQASHAH